jgi:hypothetical protein
MARCKDFPPELSAAVEGMELVFAIPKFHLPAHGFVCWSRFSLNFIPGSARVDGEGIERFWSTSNQIATSSREMTSGHRHDLLEERWSTANHRKVIDLGVSLAKKLKVAVDGRSRHTKELEEFSSAFDLALVERWKKDIENYHKAPLSHPDPYHPLSQGELITTLTFLSHLSNYRVYDGGHSEGDSRGRGLYNHSHKH